MKKKIELHEGGIYLVKSKRISDKSVNQFTLVNITETSYELKYQHAVNSYWMLISDFERDHEIIEDITDKHNRSLLLNIIPQKADDVDIISKMADIYSDVYENCYVCHGDGQIPDMTNTSMRKLCPRCLGGKRTLISSRHTQIKY